MCRFDASRAAVSSSNVLIMGLTRGENRKLSHSRERGRRFQRADACREWPFAERGLPDPGEWRAQTPQQMGKAGLARFEREVSRLIRAFLQRPFSRVLVCPELRVARRGRGGISGWSADGAGALAPACAHGCADRSPNSPPTGAAHRPACSTGGAFRRCRGVAGTRPDPS